jgi:hypothetical protein
MTSTAKSSNIAKVLSELEVIRKMLTTIQADISLNKENINLMQVKVSDMSCKIDWNISNTNIKNKNTSIIDTTSSSTDTPSGKKPSINIFCKNIYAKDPNWFVRTKLTTRAEEEALFKANPTEIMKAELKSKKDPLAVEKAKGDLIYKHLFSPDKEKIKNLKATRETEEAKEILVLSEMKETDNVSTAVEEEDDDEKINEEDIPEEEAASEEEDEESEH